MISLGSGKGVCAEGGGRKGGHKGGGHKTPRPPAQHSDAITLRSTPQMLDAGPETNPYTHAISLPDHMQCQTTLLRGRLTMQEGAHQVALVAQSRSSSAARAASRPLAQASEARGPRHLAGWNREQQAQAPGSAATATGRSGRCWHQAPNQKARAARGQGAS
jgi:hypothetical protein